MSFTPVIERHAGGIAKLYPNGTLELWSDIDDYKRGIECEAKTARPDLYGAARRDRVRTIRELIDDLQRG